tara:strand:- start:26492 stop:26920 length:429 start_codon:yes stop_codon:yes gene_type:complete
MSRILTIYNKEDLKILKQKSKRVANIDDSIRTICVKLVDVMEEQFAAGLSAPQIGILKRIVVTEEGIYINPEVLEYSEEKVIMSEGCLSIPNIFEKIDRPRCIKLKWRDTKGKPHIEMISGFNARVLQHEIDHLDGILLKEE